MTGTAQPQVVGQQGDELGGHESHLRGQLHRLLADEPQPGLGLGSEGDDRLGAQGAVLGAAEGDHVHAGGLAERPEVDTERGGGVGEAGAVEMQEQAVSVGPVSQSDDLVLRVDGSQFGALGDGDDPGLDVMFVAHTGHPPRCQFRRQFAVRRRDRQQFAAEEPLRCAALVDVDVGGVGTDDGLMRSQERLEPHHIRSGAVEGEVDLGPLAEMGGEQPVGLDGPRIVAIGGDVAGVGPRDGIEHLGMGTGPVVTGECAPARRRGEGAVHGSVPLSPGRVACSGAGGAGPRPRPVASCGPPRSR